MVNKIRKIISDVFFDANEKVFLKKKPNIILVQIVPSYYEFNIINEALKRYGTKNDSIIIGFIPKLKFYSLRDFLTLKFVLIYFNNYLLIAKWKKLYGKIGVAKFISDNNSFNFLCFSRAIKVFKNLKKKEDVINIKYNELIIGDLIYDGYVRYFNSPTIKLDYKLLTMLHYSILLYHKIDSLSIKYDIKYFITNYTNYNNSGIPVRKLLSNGIKTFAVGHDLNPFKKLSIEYFKRGPNHLQYNLEFSNLASKAEKIELGLKKLLSRLSGEVDLKYMRKSSFNNSNESFKQVEGVVFLHDFFDAQHIYEDLVFNDFYEWTIFILELIRTHKLSIGVKPHINQVSESKKVVKKLIKQYPDINWISPSVSNKEIFKKIKFGVTCYGTVISELAYNNILPICCGDNPTASFNFSIRSRSIIEHEYHILNYKELLQDYSPDKEEIGKFIYMHYIHNSKEKLLIDRINISSDSLKNI